MRCHFDLFFDFEIKSNTVRNFSGLCFLRKYVPLFLRAHLHLLLCFVFYRLAVSRGIRFVAYHLNRKEPRAIDELTTAKSVAIGVTMIVYREKDSRR